MAPSIVGDQHHRQRGAQHERRRQRDAAAVLKPVQRGPDQRGDDGERRDGDQQVQRDLALALAGGRREEQGVRQRHRHRGVDREVRDHRPRQRGQPGLVGAVGRRGAVHQAVHLGAHLTAALRGRPCHGDPFARPAPTECGGGPEVCGRAGSSSGGSHRFALGVGFDRAGGRRYAGVAGVVGHPGVLFAGVGGWARRVVARVARTRRVPVVTTRSGHTDDSPLSRRQRGVQPTGVATRSPLRQNQWQWTA